MKYMGSKNRHARFIIPFLMEHHKPEMWFVDCTVGGANLLDKIDPNLAPKRVGLDVHHYLIKMWQAVSKGWLPPTDITEEKYRHIRDNKENYPPELVGYVGFAFSYGGKWWGGYRRDVAGVQHDPELKAWNESEQNRKSFNSLKKQAKLLRGVEFKEMSLFDLNPIEKSTLYIDPPYRGTTKYKHDFDHDRFYDWCRDMRDKGHGVYVSEYNMPDDFTLLWEREVSSSLTKDTGSKRATEKLFTLL